MGESILSTYFIDTLTGFIGTMDSIYKTTDGGLNWKRPEIESNMEPGKYFRLTYCSDIIFVSKDTGYVSGRYGTLITTNGGESFSVHKYLSYYCPHFFHFYSTSHTGYIIPYNPPVMLDFIIRFPYIIKTIDYVDFQGYQMLSKTISNGNYPTRTAMDYPSDNLGFIIAKDILCTKNGGGEVLDHPYEEYVGAIQDMKTSTIFFYLTPNPNTGKFIITMNASMPIKQLNIFNVLGKQVWKQYRVEANTEIDASNLPAGIYFVTLQTDSGNFTQKIIKQ